MCYLQLLLLEHVRSRGVEYVVSQLSLTIYVDGCCGFTGQEAVVDLPGTLRELERQAEWVAVADMESGEQVEVQIKRHSRIFGTPSLLREGV